MAQWLMKGLSLVTSEVVYPLRYSQWYNADANGYDFASNVDLADLERIHPRWTFEAKLESWEQKTKALLSANRMFPPCFCSLEASSDMLPLVADGYLKQKKQKVVRGSVQLKCATAN